jgi:hypothetical protein
VQQPHVVVRQCRHPHNFHRAAGWRRKRGLGPAGGSATMPAAAAAGGRQHYSQCHNAALARMLLLTATSHVPL